MRAREIEKWLAKTLSQGATEIADAEVARHIVRVFELANQAYERAGRYDREHGIHELVGSVHGAHCEIGTSYAVLKARADVNEARSLQAMSQMAAKVLNGPAAASPAASSGRQSSAA